MGVLENETFIDLQQRSILLHAVNVMLKQERDKVHTILNKVEDKIQDLEKENRVLKEDKQFL